MFGHNDKMKIIILVQIQKETFTYSQRKNRMAITVQITANAAIMVIGSKTPSNSNPREVAFISLIPCVKGRIFAIRCKMGGIVYRAMLHRKDQHREVSTPVIKCKKVPIKKCRFMAVRNDIWYHSNLSAL